MEIDVQVGRGIGVVNQATGDGVMKERGAIAGDTGIVLAADARLQNESSAILKARAVLQGELSAGGIPNRDISARSLQDGVVHHLIAALEDEAGGVERALSINALNRVVFVKGDARSCVDVRDVALDRARLELQGRTDEIDIAGAGKFHRIPAGTISLVRAGEGDLRVWIVRRKFRGLIE